MWTAAPLLLLAGCDQGEQHDQSPVTSPLRVLGANAGPTRALPKNQRIEIAFDRLLLPSTVTRQAVALRETGGALPASPVVTYDPVRRVVALEDPGLGPDWLKSGHFYSVTLNVPPEDDDSRGLRAIDRATLARPVVIGFEVVDAIALPSEPTADFCADVLPLFQSKCGGGACHGAPAGERRPAAALMLETGAGVRHTAVARVAHGASTGPRSGVGRSPGPRFGVDMAIIEPGSPSSSWLMYKLLLAPPPPSSPPSTRFRCPRPGETDPVPGRLPFGPLPGAHAEDPHVAPFAPLSEDERSTLREHVLGREMPYPTRPGDPPGSGEPAPLTFDELERVRLWISQGAVVRDCSACD